MQLCVANIVFFVNWWRGVYRGLCTRRQGLSRCYASSRSFHSGFDTAILCVPPCTYPTSRARSRSCNFYRRHLSRWCYHRTRRRALSRCDASSCWFRRDFGKTFRFVSNTSPANQARNSTYSLHTRSVLRWW